MVLDWKLPLLRRTPLVFAIFGLHWKGGQRVFKGITLTHPWSRKKAASPSNTRRPVSSWVGDHQRIPAVVCFWFLASEVSLHGFAFASQASI